MALATKSLQKISSRYNGSLEEKKVDGDRNLIEMIYTMLQLVPDSMSKAMWKLELQQKIDQIKYSGDQVAPSDSVPVAPHLRQVLQTFPNNYFEFISPMSVLSPTESCFINTPILFFWVLREKQGRDRIFLFILKKFGEIKEQLKQCNSLSFSDSSFFNSAQV